MASEERTAGQASMTLARDGSRLNGDDDGDDSSV